MWHLPLTLCIRKHSATGEVAEILPLAIPGTAEIHTVTPRHLQRSVGGVSGDALPSISSHSSPQHHSPTPHSAALSRESAALSTLHYM